MKPNPRYCFSFKLEPKPETMTIEQATSMLHHYSPAYAEYDLWSLKDNARRYLATGNLVRAINQTRLALLTYREIRKCYTPS